MIRGLLILVFSLAKVSTYAQYSSVNGEFEVAEISGCAPFTVQIITPPAACGGVGCDIDWEGDGIFDDNLIFTHEYDQPGIYNLTIQIGATGSDRIEIIVFDDIPPSFDLFTCGSNRVSYRVTDTNYDSYVVDFNDGSPVEIVPAGATGEHTYTVPPASNSVSVRGRHLNAQDNCTAASQSFTAMAVLPAPTINELRVLDQSGIQLDFSGLPNILYQLEIATNNNTTFQLVQDVYNVSSVIVTNLNTDNNYYCFRLGAFDPCDNTTVAYSNILCSSDLDLTVQNNVNQLTWNTNNTNVITFTLQRDNQTITTLPGNTFNYDDTDIVCNTTYTYQLITNYSNGSVSYSLPKSGTAFSNDPPTPVQDISASIDQNDSVILDWTQDPAFTPVEYTIFRSINSSNYLTIGTSAAPTFSDDDYSIENPVCYRVTYRDQCDNTSIPGIEACPVVLSGELQSNNSIVLNWTEYTGWENGVERYTVEKYSSDGNLLETFDAGLQTTFTDNTTDLANQINIYVVVALPNDASLLPSSSNTITIIKEPNVFYPTAFTPNGDGLNDRFFVSGQYIANFRMDIFNRWGELLFTTTQMEEGWDGTFRGNVLPEGTYVFKADIIDGVGRQFNQAGSVLLLRKK